MFHFTLMLPVAICNQPVAVLTGHGWMLPPEQREANMGHATAKIIKILSRSV